MSRLSNAGRRAARVREAAFVAALEGYQHGDSSEALLQAAGAVIASKRRIAPEHADTISVLTDNLNVAIRTYGDAAQAVRLWLAVAAEPGGRQ